MLQIFVLPVFHYFIFSFNIRDCNKLLSVPEVLTCRILFEKFDYINYQSSVFVVIVLKYQSVGSEKMCPEIIDFFYFLHVLVSMVYRCIFISETPL